MSSRYIPPAMRARAAQPQDGGANNEQISSEAKTRNLLSSSSPSKTQGCPEANLYSLREIEHYFYPEGPDNTFSSRQSTLHASAATPDDLSWVVLFKSANPRWDSDGIIFVKSSLQLLPAELAESVPQKPHSGPSTAPKAPDQPDRDSVPETDDRSTQDQPPSQEFSAPSTAPSVPTTGQTISNTKSRAIAVFSQQPPPFSSKPRSHDERQKFVFTGYFRIARLQLLEPHSEELKRMLHQKWTVTNQRTGYVKHRQREVSHWQESLGYRWAVIKFERDEETEKVKGPPAIERLEDEHDEEPDGRQEKKSVNELLREMRLGGGIESQKNHIAGSDRGNAAEGKGPAE
jgi:hypothetical protein